MTDPQRDNLFRHLEAHALSTITREEQEVVSAYDKFASHKDGYEVYLELSREPVKIPNNNKIPLLSIQMIGLIIASEMAKAQAYQDVPIHREQAKKKAKEYACAHYIEHLIDWDKFLHI